MAGDRVPNYNRALPFRASAQPPDLLSRRVRRVRSLRGGRKLTQCLGMMNFTELTSVPSDHLDDLFQGVV